MADADEWTQHIVANIAAAREARDWSQRRLARELSSRSVPVNQAAISRMESGERAPSITEVLAIADLLGVSLDALRADPEDFQSTLQWTTVQGEFRDARQRLQQAADDYEEAARRMLAELPAAPAGIPEETTRALEMMARQSCAAVALRQYQDHITGWNGQDTRAEDLSKDDVVLTINRIENNHRPGAHNHRPGK